ncbi:hypothetical protein GCM10025859_17420 [Alicyclobacillus fastidiosus]|nr:hypothetical protein GCM10025859_17420 [Alicyclobacillus fastidiosus]
MLPVVRSHEQYQSFVQQQLRIHYANGSLLFVSKDWSLQSVQQDSKTNNSTTEAFQQQSPSLLNAFVITPGTRQF